MKECFRIEQNFLQIRENAGNFALSCTLSFTFRHPEFHFFTSDVQCAVE